MVINQQLCVASPHRDHDQHFQYGLGPIDEEEDGTASQIVRQRTLPATAALTLT